MAEPAAARGREVRERLLHAAAELIAERGWTGVSTRLVAERAGVGAGLVHYHFSSLQGLLVGAATGALRGIMADAWPVLESARTPDEALTAMLASLAEYTGNDPMSLLVSETYLAATRDPELRREVAAIVLTFRSRLANLLSQHGLAAPEQTAAVLSAAIDGVLLHRALDPELTAETVTPPLRRMLAPAQPATPGQPRTSRKKDNP